MTTNSTGPALTAQTPKAAGTTLRVRVFEYDDTTGDGVWTEGLPQRPDVDVKVTAAGNVFSDREETDENGEVVFTELPSDVDFTLEVEVPPAFTNVRLSQVDEKGEKLTKTQGKINFDTTTTNPRKAIFKIPQGSPPAEIRIQAGLQPKPATLRVQVKTRLSGQDRSINGVLVSAYRNDALLDDDTTHKVGTTDGIAVLTLNRTGVVSVRAPTTLQIAGGGQPQLPAVLRSTLRGPMLVQVEAGGDHDVTLPYIGERASLHVRATFARTVLGVEQVLPVPGVTFRLSRDNAPGDTRVIEAVSDGRGWVTYYDLEDGSYTVEVVAPSLFQGTAVELERPEGGSIPVSVLAGQSTELADTFRFRARTGSVTGFVLGEGSDGGVGGAPVVLVPMDGTREAREERTEADGSFVFDDIELGTYTLGLARSRFIAADGRRWERLGNGADPTITLSADSPSATHTVRVAREEHVVNVRIVTPDGRPLAFAVIDVWDDDSNTKLKEFTLDANGFRRWVAPHAGRFSFAVHSENGQPVRRVPAVVNSETDLSFTFEGAGMPPFGMGFGGASGSPAVPAPGTAPSNNGSQAAVAGALSDLAAYPVLTGEVGGLAAPSGGGGGAPPSTVVGRVQNAIRDVLGWRPREGDAKGYLAALGQAFTSEEVEGRTVWTYTPRSYAIQADLGRVTGAQASIYARAKAALDQSLPLLERLTALDPAADEENMEAIRSVVHSDLVQLVNEFGEQGGPRVVRVDGLFESLAGPATTAGAAANPEQVGGELGELKRIFGLVRGNVNTVGEEETYTNFLIIADHVEALRQSWNANRPFFEGRAGGPEPFFGTQLVLLSRALAVVAESVQEVFFAMDSVFMRAGERQTTVLTIPNEPPMFVEGLLQWALEFAAEEGPRLIHEGGKIGANAAVPTLRRLTRLVEAAAQLAKTDPSLPAGYRTARVQRAIAELADYLGEATRLAERIGQPDAVPSAGDRQPTISDEQLRRVVFQVLQSLPPIQTPVGPAPADPAKEPRAGGPTPAGTMIVTSGNVVPGSFSTVVPGTVLTVVPDVIERFPPGFADPRNGSGPLR